VEKSHEKYRSEQSNNRHTHPSRPLFCKEETKLKTLKFGAYFGAREGGTRRTENHLPEVREGKKAGAREKTNIFGDQGTSPHSEVNSETRRGVNEERRTVSFHEARVISKRSEEGTKGGLSRSPKEVRWGRRAPALQLNSRPYKASIVRQLTERHEAVPGSDKNNQKKGTSS